MRKFLKYIALFLFAYLMFMIFWISYSSILDNYIGFRYGGVVLNDFFYKFFKTTVPFLILVLAIYFYNKMAAMYKRKNNRIIFLSVLLLFLFPVPSSVAISNEYKLVVSPYGISWFYIAFEKPAYDSELHNDEGRIYRPQYVGVQNILHPKHNYQLIHLMFLILTPVIVYRLYRSFIYRRRIKKE